MKSTILATIIGAPAIIIGALFFGAPASAEVTHNGDPSLCSSNPAFHKAHAQCADVSLNSHGGGGAPFGDRDGDGVINGEDPDSNDPGNP